MHVLRARYRLPLMKESFRVGVLSDADGNPIPW